MHRGVKQNLMTEGDRCNLIKILESILENKTSANITVFSTKCIKAELSHPTLSQSTFHIHLV